MLRARQAAGRYLGYVLLFATVLLSLSPALPSAAQTVCVGDCDASGSVTVDELITLVNIALGDAEPSACVDGMPSGSQVDIALIMQAVNNALNGCGVQPPTPAPTGTATPSATPTHSATATHPVATPTRTPTVGPFVGEFTGTFAVTAGDNQGLTGQFTIFIGANGVAGAAAYTSNGGVGSFSGVANLVTGAVTLTELSNQLNGDITISVQLKASGTGSGTFTTDNGGGTITITSRANIASNYLGVYLGTINITAGPDSANNWPIELFVLNDGSAGGDTFDPDGNGFHFQGTVNLTSGAFTLAVNGGSEGLTGITGNLTGSTLANGTFSLSNGDTGTVSFPKAAP